MLSSFVRRLRFTECDRLTHDASFIGASLYSARRCTYGFHWTPLALRALCLSVWGSRRQGPQRTVTTCSATIPVAPHANAGWKQSGEDIVGDF